MYKVAAENNGRSGGADMNIAVVILAAGRGQRMKSARTKVLHEIGGRSMIGHVLATADQLHAKRTVTVIGDHAPEVGDYARAHDPEIAVAVQAPPRGTADAVTQAIPALTDFDGVVLVLYADTPLVTPETLQALANCIDSGAAVAVLGFRPAEPGAYGRLKLDADGALNAIVEAKDASPAELEITLCNSGVMAVNAATLKDLLPKIDNNNAKQEFYLTDLVALAREAGQDCAVIEGDPEEVLGVNSRNELAIAERVFQDRMRERAMIDGATLTDPQTVYFSYDTNLGQDVTIGPNVVFGPGVEVSDGVEIKAFSHIEGATVKTGASVGPFARLRPGAEIHDNAKIGNFVEIKKAVIAEGAKVSHLSYIGDASIGAEANIGAGVITCNYDGYSKYKTVIEAGAFVGSNSALVAPVTIGEGAYVGSGSVVTKDVAPDALAVARGRQTSLPEWAIRFRIKNQPNPKGNS